jgi:prepilin-type N-terminal cleavage/methylation domain-containing protein
MRARWRRHAAATAGFTLVEAMIVVAVIGILAAVASPLMDGFFADVRLRAAARDVADTFRVARAEAIRTGTPHVVFFSAAPAAAPPATDPAGNALGVDASTGGVPPILMLRDNDENCLISAGDAPQPVYAQRGVAWGSAVSGVAIEPGDTGLADHSAGSSFRTPAGAPSTWVVFRPNGIPVGFDAGCNLGGVGTGGGAVYVTNGRRDYAVVLSPLGSVRVHAWEAGMGAWAN